MHHTIEIAVEWGGRKELWISVMRLIRCHYSKFLEISRSTKQSKSTVFYQPFLELYIHID